MHFSELPNLFVDAETEALYNQTDFDKGFYNFKACIDKLSNIDDPNCFISGRKGSGKSSFLLKIKNSFHTDSINLENLPYNSIKKIADKNAYDANKSYQPVWNLLLLNNLVFSLEKKDIVEGWKYVEEFKHISNSLGLGNDFVRSISTASKKSFKVGIPKILNVSQELSESSVSSEYDVRDLSDYFSHLFFKIKFSNKYFLLIDGVDDILATRTDKISLLAALLYTIRSINFKAKEKNVKLKVIMAIRTDLWGLVNSSDLNKLSDSNTIILDWYTGDSSLELIKLLNNRLKLSKGTAKNDEEMARDSLKLWYTLFPENIIEHGRKNDSWTYFLEYSLYRPRDVVKFIILAKENFPEKSKLNIGEFKNLINEFSKNYFFDEMTNELFGFVKNNIINDLNAALESLGRRGFKYSDFRNAFISINSNYTDDEIRDLLKTMFNGGFIGQKNSEANKYAFKHKNSRQQINYTNNFVTHRGLYAAVSID